MFLGAPGSGKTYFATRLAPKIGAVTLSGDALRLAVHGSFEKIEEMRERQPRRVYADIYAAMDYAALQILSAGHSVIYDSQQTKRKHRQAAEKLAKQVDATPILVWIKTDANVAIARGQQREAAADTHPYSLEKMTMLTERFKQNVELPDENENVVEIPGDVPFDQQFQQFTEGLARIESASR